MADSPSDHTQLLLLLLFSPIQLTFLCSRLPVRVTTACCFFLSVTALLLFRQTGLSSFEEQHTVILSFLAAGLLPLILGTWLSGLDSAKGWIFRILAIVGVVMFLAFVLVKPSEGGLWQYIDWKGDHLQTQCAVFACALLFDLTINWTAKDDQTEQPETANSEQWDEKNSRDWIRGVELQTVAYLPDASSIQSWRSLS